MREKLELLLHYGLLTPACKLEFVEALIAAVQNSTPAK
jgi:hypothetical protein